MSSIRTIFLTLIVAATSGCATTALSWPDSPLYAWQDESTTTVLSKAEVMRNISGLYAHYDVVAYEEKMGRQPMRTFIVSYGFTRFYVEDGVLYEQDRFCHAAQQINFTTVTSTFNDAATQAIVPKDQAVSLELIDGQWHIYRPATPTLLGVEGDALQPLPMDIDQLNTIDADNDGKPGVTVELLIGGFLPGKIYLVRREIFENYMIWQGGDTITGHVVDSSEQRVLGASLFFLNREADPKQHPEPSMSPILLVRLDQDSMSCDELMARRDEWFPPEPSFLLEGS